jgi:hypothetical protein
VPAWAGLAALVAVVLALAAASVVVPAVLFVVWVLLVAEWLVESALVGVAELALVAALALVDVAGPAPVVWVVWPVSSLCFYRRFAVLGLNLTLGASAKPTLWAEFYPESSWVAYFASDLRELCSFMERPSASMSGSYHIRKQAAKDVSAGGWAVARNC